MELKLDLHIHSERSPDGIMPLEEIVSLARARGLDGAAVCDHDLALTGPPRFDDFLLIPGVEVSTQLGHLLGLFVTGPVETRDFLQAVEIIHSQGGLAVLAHPFEHSRDGARLAHAVPLLDGVEVWNSRADRKIHDANALAASFAQVCRLAPFGGSDAHCPQEVGNGFVTVEAQAFTLVCRPEPADQAAQNRGQASELCEVGGLRRKMLRPGYLLERGLSHVAHCKDREKGKAAGEAAAAGGETSSQLRPPD